MGVLGQSLEPEEASDEFKANSEHFGFGSLDWPESQSLKTAPKALKMLRRVKHHTESSSEARSRILGRRACSSGSEEKLSMDE